MPREARAPPYRVLIVSDDNALIEDFERNLSLRPLQVFFVEPGPSVRVLLQRPSLRFLAFAPGITQKLRTSLPITSKYEVIPIGRPEDGISEAFAQLREAIQREGAQENLSVGIIGLPRALHRGVRRFLRQTVFLIATVYSREEALDPSLLGQTDLVLLDSKIGEIDNWSFVPRLLRADPGSGLPVFGIVPRVDVDILKQSVEHSVAGFLLRSLIDARLFGRLEAVGRTGLRKRSDQGEDPRFMFPSPTQHGLGDPEEPSATDSELDLSAARELFHTIQEDASFKDARDQGLVGETFGRIRLESIIGRGGSGTVYVGWHLTLHTTVAVKVLFAEDVARDPRFAHRFIEEARLAARIEHPNAVRVVDFDRDDETGCYYLAMELVPGATLLQLIRSQGALDEPAVLEIAEKVADVLAAAQQVGVVHRDITPANILITDRSDVKLADLGIAKVVMDAPLPTLRGSDTSEFEARRVEDMLNAAVGVPVHTATGVLVGTPHYIAPEQSRDARLVDLRCDMYSLGATLYHAVTGRTPYTGVTIEQIVAAHTDDPIPDPLEYAPELSACARTLIQKLLAKQPRERFSSYDQLLAAIRACRRKLEIEEYLAEVASRGLRGRVAAWFVRRLAPEA